MGGELVVSGSPGAVRLDKLRPEEIEAEADRTAQVIANFEGADWIDQTMAVSNPHRRVNVDYKNFPYRGNPVEGPHR
jgi:hypothetical protein